MPRFVSFARKCTINEYCGKSCVDLTTSLPAGLEFGECAHGGIARNDRAYACKRSKPWHEREQLLRVSNSSRPKASGSYRALGWQDMQVLGDRSIL